MNRLLNKLRQIEKSFNLSEYYVQVIKFYGETEKEALDRHLKNNPPAAGKEYIFLTKYGNEDNYVDTYEEMIQMMEEEERK